MTEEKMELLYAACPEVQEGRLADNLEYQAHVERQRRILRSLEDGLNQQQRELLDAFRKELMVDMLMIERHFFVQGVLLGAEKDCPT